MSVKYEVLKALVRAIDLKKRWDMPLEELLENRRRANAKNKIPELHAPDMDIDRIEVDGCPVLTMKHQKGSGKANLFIIGGGMISAPRPASVKKALRFARETGLDLYVPYYPLYETKISDARRWLYDIPGNAGWIIYFVCVVQLLRQGIDPYAIVSVLPAILMLIGIAEQISERIARLDRILPRKRLLRGFGALTLGGILGVIVSVIVLTAEKCSLWLMIGAVLCAVFAGLLYKGYRRVEG